MSCCEARSPASKARGLAFPIRQFHRGIEEKLMEIVEHTSNILKLKAKGGAWSSLPIKITLPVGPIFFFAGLAVTLLAGKVATLNCDRIEPTQITCELTSSGLLSHNVKSIEQLKGAELESKRSRRTRSRNTYRVALLAKSGKIPLTDVYSSGGSSSRNVALINNFVNNPGANNLKIKEDHRWVAYPFGLLFMLVGGWIFIKIASLKTLVSFTLNKTSSQANFKYQNILLQSEIRQEELDNIEIARVDETVSSSKGQNYNINLILKSGKSIDLMFFQDRSELAEAINQFLDVNEQ